MMFERNNNNMEKKRSKEMKNDEAKKRNKNNQINPLKSKLKLWRKRTELFIILIIYIFDRFQIRRSEMELKKTTQKKNEYLARHRDDYSITRNNELRALIC